MEDFTEWCLPVFTLVCAKLLQSRPTLYDSVDCSPPGSLSVGFSRQEYWSGLPYPPPGDLPNPGIEPYVRDSLLCLLPWQTGSIPLAPPGEPIHFGMFFKISIILKMWPYQTEDDNLSCNWPGKKKSCYKCNFSFTETKSFNTLITEIIPYFNWAELNWIIFWYQDSLYVASLYSNNGKKTHML